MSITETKTKDWDLIFKYYKKVFMEKDQEKSDSLFKLVRKLQLGGN